MPFLQTPDLNIYYESVGEGETPLVLIHGNAASWRWWKPVFDRLPLNQYTAYAPDLRGCGDTEQPEDGYTIAQMARDLHHFVTQLGLTKFHLGGHSLGGAVVTQFTLDYPDLVESLLLVAPAPPDILPALKKRKARAERFWGTFNMSPDSSLGAVDVSYRLLKRFGTNYPLLRRNVRRLLKIVRDERVVDVLVNDALRMSPYAASGFLKTLQEWDVFDRLPEIRQQVLIIGGQFDHIIPRASLERMEAALPHAYLIVWEDVGHCPQLETPDRFITLLLNFLHQAGDTGSLQLDPLTETQDVQKFGWVRRQFSRAVTYLGR